MELYEDALKDAMSTNDSEEISIVIYNIAEMYEKGYGVDLNYRKAISLYEESASYGLEEAVKKLDDLKNNDSCELELGDLSLEKI